ncbi:MAG TPA: hypothetical protein VG096_04875 [Bryobacteraceae bacterium]|jgi:hypothetical protein|nr:hypothetical protein [Bryobacteraceae bacterium]
MKKDTIRLLSLLAAFLFAFTIARAQQTLIIPQIVDGGAWQTTIVVINTSSGQTSASLRFYQDIGQSGTQPWYPTFLESSLSMQNFLLPAQGALFLHTSGTAAATTIGWGQVTEMDSLGAVAAYAIFTQRIPGHPDQDGTAPATTAGSRILVPFDNTDNAVTSIAIANPTLLTETISVTTQNGSATANGQLSIVLPAQGHSSFDFPTRFPSTVGQSGLAEFYCAGGTISILALKFNSSAFTTMPVYGVLGAPLAASDRFTTPVNLLVLSR